MAKLSGSTAASLLLAGAVVTGATLVEVKSPVGVESASSAEPGPPHSPILHQPGPAPTDEDWSGYDWGPWGPWPNVPDGKEVRVTYYRVPIPEWVWEAKTLPDGTPIEWPDGMSVGDYIEARVEIVDPAEPPPPDTPVEGLVLHLSMDGASGADSSGAERHVECSSCPEAVDGRCDFGGHWFEGLSSGPVPSGTATTFTLATFVEFDHLGDRLPIASKQGDPERGWVLETSQSSGGRLRWECWPAGAASQHQAVAQTAFQPGVEYHVAVTCDEETTKLYIDGTEEWSGSMPPPRQNAKLLQVGRYYWSSGYSKYLDGKLDEFRVYDRALSQEEVVALVGATR